MKVYKGVSWIADKLSVAPSERDANWMHHRKDEVWLSSALRKRYPLSRKAIFRGKRDVKFKHNKNVIITTHPRPYEQWIYDCLKVDIAIVCRRNEIKAAEKRFQSEKSAALKRKSNLSKMLSLFSPSLAIMHKKGIIDVVIGRGSYFDVNGYPSEKDDIDLILLKEEKPNYAGSYKIINEKITEFISDSKGDFGVNLISFDEKTIKKPLNKHAPTFSLILIMKGYNGLGTLYERYVLEKGVPVKIPGLKVNDAKRITRKFASNLNKDTREMQLRENKLTVFPKNTNNS